MTETRPLTDLEKLAVEVAITPNFQQDLYAVDAKVPWSVIHALRSELDNLGIDWKDLRRKYVEIRNKRKKTARASMQEARNG